MTGGRLRTLAVALGLLLTAPAARAADPEWAALGSLLLPGVGQIANGDYAAGGAQVALTFVLVKQYSILINDPAYLEPKDRVDSANNLIHINRTSFDADLYGTALTDLTLYSAFGAYRDARNARDNRGYATPAPRESLGDLALAPFRWEFLSRPTTWVPLLAALYFAVSPPAEGTLRYAPDSTITRQQILTGSAVQFDMVAVGEEAFFRGLLNNGLSSSLGETWGLAASSTLFGLAHEGTGAQASIAGAALFGAYLGWLQQRNEYAIGEGVALHYWWDLLVTAGLLHERRASAQGVRLMTIHWRF